MNEQENNEQLDLFQKMAIDILIICKMDWVIAYHNVVNSEKLTGVQKYIIGNYIKKYRNECEEAVKVLL